jgi:Mor family transcriptional regulator
MKLLENIKIEDLNPDARLLADNFGIEIVKEMIEKFGGMYIYIPRRTGLHKAIKRYIKDNPGKTAIEYAKELEISVNVITRILSMIA